DHYPTSPTDGTLFDDSLSYSGDPQVKFHNSLTNGVTYYYSLYAHDDLGNYSTVANLSATPNPPPKVNLLTNPSMSTFSSGVATGWNAYRANDTLNRFNFF